MIALFNIWEVLAGVAIFLLGIKLLEESLQQLAGRRFKLFLKKHTTHRLKAIAGGAIVTGVLQSSSLVSLMVLAFVGAGVIQMQNALAVILGANLGTTLDSWIVALIGFKVNIERVALPAVGIAGLGYAIFHSNTSAYNWSRFFLGFGFLFVGLGYMKNGISALVSDIDLAQYEHSPVIVFFLLGLAVTSLIQSSSATMAITLSALYSGAISLYDSMAVILGSEVGTTLKLFIAGLKGIAAKRRVALGNFIFNSINVTVVLLLLTPVYRFITELIGIKDVLIALVFFQSLVNVIGIILFYPLLGTVSRYLEKTFLSADDETMFIHKVAAREPSMALYALEEESRHFIYIVLHYAQACFQLPDYRSHSMGLSEKITERPLPEKYEHIKFLYGEIHSYFVQLLKDMSEKDESEKLDRLMAAVRNAMYAAKSFKDALTDLNQLQQSSNDVKYNFYMKTRQEVEQFCSQITALMQNGKNHTSAALASYYEQITRSYNDTLQYLYKEGTAGHVSETEITTLLNFNREIFTAFKSLLFALKDFLLDREQSKYFDERPGFIR
jgi:phosphate:Na+ symporter